MADAVAPLQDFTAKPEAPPQPDQPIVVPKLEPLPSGLSIQAGVDALDNVVSLRKDALTSTIDASNKNAAVARQVQSANDYLDEDTIDAYDKISNISKYPAGISRVMGFFDSDWNAQYQQTRINANTLKAAQIQKKAEAITAINNQKPAIDKLRGDIAQQDFGFRKDLLDFAIKNRDLDQKQVGLLIQNEQLKMAMTEEQRKQIDFALNSMSDVQAAAELKRAQKGEGPFANFPGLLQDRIDRGIKGNLELKQLDNAVANGDLELADKSALRAMKSLSTQQLLPIYQQAQSAGQAFVQIGKRQIPTHIIGQALQENLTQEQFIRNSALAASNDQINEQSAQVNISLRALAVSGDPEAARLTGQLDAAIRDFKPTDPTSVQGMRALLGSLQDKTKEIAKRRASTMPTPEAKAAVEEFGTTGQYTPEGALAVVRAQVGSPFQTQLTKHSDAFNIVNTELAKRVAMQNLSGMPSFNGSQQSTQALLAWVGRSQKVQNIKELTDEVLSDPTIASKVADQIGTKLSIDAMTSTFAEFAKQPGAAPVWQEFVNNPSQFQTNGDWSLAKIVTRLEGETVKNRGQADYNQLLLTAIRTKGVVGNTAGDPSATFQDFAIEKAFLGNDPQRAAISTLLQRLSADSAAVHQQMQERIQQDVSGATEQQNFSDRMKSQGELKGLLPPGLSQKQVEAAKANSQGAPSATGIPGLSAAQVRSLYGK